MGTQQFWGGVPVAWLGCGDWGSYPRQSRWGSSAKDGCVATFRNRVALPCGPGCDGEPRRRLGSWGDMGGGDGECSGHVLQVQLVGHTDRMESRTIPGVLTLNNRE